MKMKVFVLGLLFSLSVQSAPVAKLGTGFSAPTVAGTANVYSPQFGDIVYDSSSTAFWGFDQTSTWQQLGGGAGSSTPAGVISAFGGTSAPGGYLMCDGSAVSRITYAALYAVIGTAFGYGDNSTTFNLPDLRGRFLRGRDDGAGNDPDAGGRTPMASGGASGDNVGSIQGHQFESHHHSGIHTFSAMGTGTVDGGAPNRYWVINTNNDTANTGGQETRPRNAYVNYIIKY